jgi:hypothetical protein
MAGLAIGTLIAGLTQAVGGIRQNRLGLLAKTAAIRQLERVRNTPFSLIDTLNGDTFAADLAAIPGATGQTLICNYNPATGACDAGGDPNLKHVTVRVTLDPARVWRQVSLITRS